MINILFINEKWPANIKEYGESNSSHVLHSAFKNTGLGNYKTFHFDEYWYQHNKKGDFKLLEEVLDYKPDLIVFSWLVGIHNPEIDTFKIMHKMGVKIACIWWDFMWQPSMQTAEELSPFVDMHIIMDNPFAAFQIPMHSKRKHLPMWTPNDQTLFYGDPLSDRQIDICFGGDVYRDGGYRAEYIDRLEKLNYNIFVSGKMKEERVSIQEYVDKLRQVKIVPNFTKGTLKGRVFETTLTGAMLMEPEKSVCSAYFEPNKDYVAYIDSNDFFDKVKYYLEHNNERLDIASSGHRRATNKYNTERFWKIILNKLGILKYVDEDVLYKTDYMKIDEAISKSYIPI